jgi:hypothetical protein
MTNLGLRSRLAQTVGICLVLVSAATAQDDAPAGTGPASERSAESKRDYAAELFADSAERRPYYTREIEGIPLPDELPPLTIEGQLQFRFTSTNQTREDQEHSTGFSFRRARIGVEGVVTDSIEYSIEGAFGRDDGLFALNDATIVFKLSDDLRFKLGRFRPFFYREEDVSSKRQIFVDRTLLQSVFGLPRTYGAQIEWEGDWLRASAGVADQTHDFEVDEDFVYTVRSDVLLEGKWKQFRTFSAPPDQELAIMAGVGLLYLESSLSESGTGDVLGSVVRWTADVTAMRKGLSAFAAVVGSQGGEDARGDGVNQYGFSVQGSWRMNETWELAARYEYGDADQLAKDMSIITLGVNYYIADHALKWQNDIGFALNEVNGFWSSTTRGWLTDRAGDDGQIVFRSQIQLLF